MMLLEKERIGGMLKKESRGREKVDKKSPGPSRNEMVISREKLKKGEREEREIREKGR